MYSYEPYGEQLDWPSARTFLAVVSGLIGVATALFVVEQFSQGLLSSVSRVASLVLLIVSVILVMGRVDIIRGRGQATTLGQQLALLAMAITVGAVALVVTLVFGATQGRKRSRSLVCLSHGAGKRPPKNEPLVVSGLGLILLAVTFYVASRGG